MEPTAWQVILHEIGTIIAGTAAVIAALSSLRNGNRLKNGSFLEADQSATRKAPKKKTSNGASKEDWYKPPKLG